MKKTVKIICLLLVLFIFKAPNIDAAINISSYKTVPGKNGNYGDYFGDDVILQANFKVNGIDGIPAYCHNPGVLAFTDADAKNNLALLVKRNLGDPQNGRTQNIIDAGIMSILTSGSTTQYSKAKYIAINLYEQLFPKINSNGNNSSSAIPYLKYLINTRLYDDIKGDLKTLSKNMGSYDIISSKFSDKSAKACTGSYCGTSSDINSAISLVKQALKAAIKYANDGEATATIANVIQTRAVKTEADKFTYKDAVVHTITIAKFGDDNGGKSGSVKLNFECTNDACRKASKTFYIDDKEVEDLSSINLVNYTNNGSGSVKFKVEFAGDTCDEISYKLSSTFNHYTVSGYGYSVAKCNNSNKCQGFYVADANSATHTKTVSVEKTISLCQTPGEKTSCTAKIDNVDCVECKSNTHSLDIVEGYDYSNSNVCDTSDGTLNISKCIANDGAVDTADHTYKNSELSEDTKNNNAGVYCKEDYHLEMPGSIMVGPGRYFILKSSIKGVQSCYTNNLQNKTTVADVKSQIAEHAAETVNAYNEIQKYKAIADCVSNGGECITLKKEKVKSCGYRYYFIDSVNQKDPIVSHTDMGYEVRRCDPGWTLNDWGKCQKTVRTLMSKTLYIYKIVANIKVTYNVSSCDGGGTRTYSEKFWESDPRDCGQDQLCNGERCNPNTSNEPYYGDIKEETKTMLSESEKAAALAAIGTKSTGHWSGGRVGADGKVSGGGGSWVGDEGSGLSVEVGTGSVVSDINTWNNATGYSGLVAENDFDDTPFDNGWKMSYNFDPQLYFWYQEEYMKNAKTDQMDMYNKSLSGVTAQYCEGDVSPDYKKCYKTGTKTEIPWTNVPSIERGNVCICWGPDPGDCGVKNYVLSKVRYVIQSQNAEAKFISPTQFYSVHPTGSIVVADQGKEDEIENSKELTNGLPVALGLNGTRKYVLWYEKLGEYFDKDTLGRVWGESDSVVNKLLKNRTTCNNENSAFVAEDNTEGVIHSEGVYACKYSTDCPETDCPPGDPDCPDSNSCKKPSESPDNNYHCKDGEVCDEDEYNKECNDPNNYTCSDPKIDNDKYTYCENLPYGCKANDENCKKVCRENVDQKQYKQDCCPNGKCPVTTGYVCAVSTNEKGELVYYDKNGQKTDQSTYKAQCCPDGKCPVTCKYCLYDGNKLNIQYRPITSEDLNPNDRELAPNWKWDEPIETALELKAYVTTKEIENDGDSIYDVNDKDLDDTTSKDDKYVMKVTMDANMISKIRKYNDQHSSFVNNTLKCYDRVEEDRVYKNIYCYSTFIDDLLKDSKTSKNIKFSVERPLDEKDRKDTVNNEKYFTTWITADSSKWDVTTTTELAYYKEHYGMEIDYDNNKIADYHVGPSWK